MPGTRTLSVLTTRELFWLVALFLLTLPGVTPRLYSSDEIQYFSYLRSLWFDHDVAFENEYRHFYERGVASTDGFRATFLEPMTPTGKRENFATLGAALLWAPFYAVADVSTRLARAAGSSPADGYSRHYIAAVAYGSAVYGFLAILLSIAAARRIAGDGIVAGLSVWLGTPLLFYMYAAPPFSHACSAFAVALFVTVWLHAREQWTTRGLIALGATAALMTMVREQDVFFTLGPAVDYALTLRERVASGADGRSGCFPPQRGTGATSSAVPVKWVVPVIAGITTFIVVYSPQLFAYRSLNGRFGPSTLVTRKMTWTAPHAIDVLISVHHGFLIWTPLAVLAIVGLLLLARRRYARRVAACMLLMLAFQVYISGSVQSWSVAGAFGQRRFVGATILLVVGLAGLWQSLPRGVPRITAGVAVALAIWWNIGLMALFGAGLMNRQRLEPGRNAYDVFVTLPRAGPELAYRYIMRRESFYKSPADR